VKNIGIICCYQFDSNVFMLWNSSLCRHATGLLTIMTTSKGESRYKGLHSETSENCQTFSTDVTTFMNSQPEVSKQERP